MSSSFKLGINFNKTLGSAIVRFSCLFNFTKIQFMWVKVIGFSFQLIKIKKFVENSESNIQTKKITKTIQNTDIMNKYTFFVHFEDVCCFHKHFRSIFIFSFTIEPRETIQPVLSFLHPLLTSTELIRFSLCCCHFLVVYFCCGCCCCEILLNLVSLKMSPWRYKIKTSQVVVTEDINNKKKK